MNAVKSLFITEKDLQRMQDRDAVQALKLERCPICARQRWSNSQGLTPYVYRGRWFGKWMMRSGPVGCRHMNEKQFNGMHETPEALAILWNDWCKIQAQQLKG